MGRKASLGIPEGHPRVINSVPRWPTQPCVDGPLARGGVGGATLTQGRAGDAFAGDAVAGSAVVTDRVAALVADVAREDLGVLADSGASGNGNENPARWRGFSSGRVRSVGLDVVAAFLHLGFPDVPELLGDARFSGECQGHADVPVLRALAESGEYVIADVGCFEADVSHVFGSDKPTDKEAHADTLPPGKYNHRTDCLPELTF